jgi:hypothetical protein
MSLARHTAARLIVNTIGMSVCSHWKWVWTRLILHFKTKFKRSKLFEFAFAGVKLESPPKKPFVTRKMTMPIKSQTTPMETKNKTVEDFRLDTRTMVRS